LPFRQDAQTQGAKIAGTIRLSHHHPGPVICAFDRPIGDARWQKAKEGQDFLLPVGKRRKRLAQLFWPALANTHYPLLQAFLCCQSRGLCIPLAQILFDRPGGFQSRQMRSNARTLLFLLFRQFLQRFEKEALCDAKGSDLFPALHTPSPPCETLSSPVE